jgi:hypothetical protein
MSVPPTTPRGHRVSSRSRSAGSGSLPETLGLPRTDTGQSAPAEPSAGAAADPTSDPDVAQALDRIEQASGSLAATSIERMHASMPWFSALPPEHRAAVTLVLQLGVTSFVEWCRRPYATRQLSGDPFRTAPRELVRAVSLRQVVELVRIAVEVVEDEVPQLAAPAVEHIVRELVLRYSREVAFAAAMVYANAAEERGAWDARLEALVVDSVLRGDTDDSLLSRAAALGWSAPGGVAVVAGRPPGGDADASVHDAHWVAKNAGMNVLAGVNAERLVLVVGLDGPPIGAARALLDAFGPGPVVVGPAVEDLRTAVSSAEAALAGTAAAAAWTGAPRPVNATDLLPERALMGDASAAAELVEVFRILSSGNGTLIDTVCTYLEVGASLEATGRVLFLHPNTVRYRLRKAADLCGLDPAEPRDAFTLRTAVALGRLAAL